MEKNEKVGVVHPEVKQFVVNIIFFFRNIINSVGLIVGSVVLSLIDVALGGVVLGQLFIDYKFEVFGHLFSGSVIGWGLSIVFWYVQLLLWDLVFKDGKITKSDIPAILIAVMIALIDTFGDSSSVILATTNSSLKTFLQGQTMFGFPVFDVLVDLMFVAVLIITGFNEFFNKLITSDADIDFFGEKGRKQIRNQTKQNPMNVQYQQRQHKEPSYHEVKFNPNAFQSRKRKTK